MGKKIFLDMGYHRGQGLREFSEKLGIDQGWDVHCWEPNPKNFRHFIFHAIGDGDEVAPHIENPFGYRINVCNHREAVWCRDEKLVLRQESNNGADDGWGSTVVGDSLHKNLNRTVEVQGIDIVDWIFENTSADDEVYIKMDIEGAEFGVIPRMLASPSVFDRIEKMWVEYHERYIPGWDRERRVALHGELSKHVDAELHW